MLEGGQLFVSYKRGSFKPAYFPRRVRPVVSNNFLDIDFFQILYWLLQYEWTVKCSGVIVRDIVSKLFLETIFWKQDPLRDIYQPNIV